MRNITFISLFYILCILRLCAPQVSATATDDGSKSSSTTSSDVPEEVQEENERLERKRSRERYESSKGARTPMRTKVVEVVVQSQKTGGSSLAGIIFIFD